MSSGRYSVYRAEVRAIGTKGQREVLSHRLTLAERSFYREAHKSSQWPGRWDKQVVLKSDREIVLLFGHLPNTHTPSYALIPTLLPHPLPNIPSSYSLSWLYDFNPHLSLSIHLSRFLFHFHVPLFLCFSSV